MVVALVIVTILAACATTFSLPKTTKSGSINQENYSKMGGPAALSGVMVSPSGLPIYASFSIYRGNKPWKSDPKTEIARQTSGNVEIRIRADGASPESVAVAQQFAADVARTFSAMDAKVWKSDHKRSYDIKLLMFPPGTKISRKYERIFLGKKFRIQFYIPFYASDKARDFGQMYGDAAIIAHELYHLRVSRLGGVKIRPYRKDLTKAQRRILEEAGAQFMGACMELRVKKVVSIGSQVIFSKHDPDTGQTRFGTLSDQMMLAVLKPGSKIAPEDYEPLGPMLFATFWTEHAGANSVIHQEDEAAKRMQDVCENYIAHPTDLWSVFWQMASDGDDAPVLIRPVEQQAGS